MWLDKEKRRRIEHKRSLQLSLAEHYSIKSSKMSKYRENRADNLGPGNQGELKGGNGGDDAANRAFHALVLLLHQHLDRAGFHYNLWTLRAPTARLRLGVETLVKLHDHSSAEQSSELPRLSVNKSQQ